MIVVLIALQHPRRNLLAHVAHLAVNNQKRILLYLHLRLEGGYLSRGLVEVVIDAVDNGLVIVARCHQGACLLHHLLDVLEQNVVADVVRQLVDEAVRDAQHHRVHQVLEYRDGGAGDKALLLLGQLCVGCSLVLDAGENVLDLIFQRVLIANSYGRVGHHLQALLAVVTVVNFRRAALHHGLNNVTIRGAGRQRRDVTLLVKNQGAGERHDELPEFFIPAEHAVLAERIPDDIDVFSDALFISGTGLVAYLVEAAAHGAALPGCRPVCKHVALAGNVLADLLLGDLGARKQTADNPLRRLAGAEVHAVNVAGHLLQEVFSSLDFRYRGLQRQIEEVSGRIGHNLLGETLQLIAVNKAEGAQIGIDAAAAGVDVGQRHGDKLDGFHLRARVE